MNMLVLDTTTKSIEIKLAGTVTANQLDVTTHYADATSTGFVEGSSDSTTNNTSAVTIVSSPSASTRRIVREITVHNKDTASATVTIQLNNNSTIRIIKTVTLATGEEWTLSDNPQNTILSDGDRGDITVSNGGTTWSIDNNAVTFAKMQAITDGKLLGASGGTAIEEITVGTGLSLSANTLTATASGGGDKYPMEFRLTLESGVPVSVTDQTAKTTIYCTPYSGNQIALYSGSAWSTITSAEFSIAIGTLTSGLPYDVFCYNNSGTATLEILAWTSGTARATALTTQDGVLVKSGATTRRYLGTFYTASTTTTEDSLQKRYVWNYYNRVKRDLKRIDSTANWAATGTGWQLANTPAPNYIECVVGWRDDTIVVMLSSVMDNNGSAQGGYIGIKVNATTGTPEAVGYLYGASRLISSFGVIYTEQPALGYNYYSGMERALGSYSVGFLGNSAGEQFYSITGLWRA